MANPPPSQQPRSWDWIFRTLHQTSQTHHHSTSSSSISLNIPSTVLFYDSVPTKWIITLPDGHVGRQDLLLGREGGAYTSRGGGEGRQQTPTMSTNNSTKNSKSNNEVLIREQCKVIHDQFVVFREGFDDWSSSSLSSSSPNEQPFLCIAWYTDGKIEYLRSASLKMLQNHKEWRLQLIALQSYIPPKNTKFGVYDVNAVKNGGIDDNGSDEGLNILTKSLAKFAENSYTPSSSSTSTPKTNLKVSTMNATYIIDPSGKLWFTHLTKTLITLPNLTFQTAQTLLRDKTEKEVTAANIVACEFKRLLKMASARGVPVSSSFRHFDLNDIGYCDVHMLIAGLQRLGIGISIGAAGVLMEIIGVGSGLSFRGRDLVVFAELNDDYESENENEEVQIVETKTKKPSAAPTVSSPSRPPLLQPHLSLNLNVDNYVNENRRTLKPNSPSSTLPDWARSKSKKAYSELKRADERFESNKRKEEERKKDVDYVSEEEEVEEKVEVIKVENDDDENDDDGDDTRSQSTSSLFSSSTTTNPNITPSDADVDMDIDIDDADSLYHCSNSIVMTYRILTSPSNPNPNKKTGATTLQQTASFQKSKEIINRMLPEKQTPFQIIVTPDIFMTLDTLEESLSQLLDTHPNSSILLVGLPGLPNTMWPKGTILNNETHAECLDSLLQHLHSNRKFTTNSRTTPLFLLGFGNGASCLTFFASNHYHDAHNYNLRQATKALILVNSFASINQELKKNIQQIRRVLNKGNVQERMQLLLSVLFSEEYLNETGRKEAMATFWKTRGKITITDTPTKEARAFKRSSLISGNGKDGVLALLHGMQSHIDITSNFDLLSVPLLLVQSTQDRFVSPTNIQAYEQTQAEEEYTVVESPRDLLPVDTKGPPKFRVIRVEWLKSGHELIQERGGALNAMIMKLVKAAHSENAEVEVENLEVLRGYEKDVEKVHVLSDFFDILDDEAGVTNHTSQPPSRQTRNRNNNTTTTTTANISTVLPLPSSSLVSPASSDSPIKSPELAVEEKQEKKRDRRAREAAIRKQREEERKTRKLQDERQVELKSIRAIETARVEKASEMEERHLMHREDMYSSLAEDYVLECEEWEVNADIARMKASELVSAREDDEMNALEFIAAKKKAEKHELRRQHMDNLRKQYLDDELAMDGDDSSLTKFTKDTQFLNAIQAAVFCKNLLADLLQCRARMIEAIKRANHALTKVTVFQGEFDNIEREVRGLRRTQRLAVTNTTFQAIKPSKRELGELQQKLSDYELQMEEIKALLNGRNELLELSNKSVQGLKLVLKNKEDTVYNLLSVLENVQNKLTSKLAVYRVTLSNYQIERSEITKILSTSEVRLKVVNFELKRVEKHKGKYVDTDVWNKGVVQRMQTLDIRAHLAREQSTLLRVLNDFRRSLKEADFGIGKCQKDIEEVGRENLDLFDVSKEMASGIARTMAKSVSEEFEEQLIAELEAIAKNELADSNIDNQPSSLADKVRLKNTEKRTRNEKMWVSMDVLINPDAYNHVTEVEAESMKYDVDYSYLNFAATDVTRLLNLPTRVNLAMPFLYSKLEVEAHGVLNMYTTEEGESYYKDLDGKSQDVNPLEDAAAVAKARQVKAKFQLDVLLKEHRVNVVRGTPRVELDYEQRNWITLDKILNPFLHQHGDAQTDIVGGDGKLKSNPPQPPTHTPMGMGDVYIEGRELYENHEQPWVCPYDEISLRSIYITLAEDLDDPDERYVKSLLNKYHVSDGESRIGVKGRFVLDGIESVLVNLRGRVMPGDWGDESVWKSGVPTIVPTIVESKLKVKVNDETQHSHKMFGTSSVIHPASIGRDSQSASFNRFEFNDEVDHPASYRYYVDVDADVDGEAKNENGLLEKSINDTIENVNVLTADFIDTTNTPNSLSSSSSKPKPEPVAVAYKIVKTLEELSRVNQTAIKSNTLKVLYTSGKTHELYSESNLALESRQSRSHVFDVSDFVFDYADGDGGGGVDDGDERKGAGGKLLDLTVSVVFQGVFGVRGYRLGRVAAQLYRLPSSSSSDQQQQQQQEKQQQDDYPNTDTDTESQSHPKQLGHAPYPLQVLNSPETLGRIILHHTPTTPPVKQGQFKVVVGAASAAKYSILVYATIGEDVKYVLNREIQLAVSKQDRLNVLTGEINDVWDSMRLSERKILVCSSLVGEAEVESVRCESDISSCNTELTNDDQTQTMTDVERSDVFREIKVLEVEFGHWCRLYATRVQEKKDVKDGLEYMALLRRERVREKETLAVYLEGIRRELPAAVGKVFSADRARSVAGQLNAPLNLIATDANSRWKTIAGGKNMQTAQQLLTPAEEVRKLYRTSGVKALTLEERQFAVLDRCVNPDKWTWLQTAEEADDRARELTGAKVKKRKVNAAVEIFQLELSDINRIMKSSFTKLNRRDGTVKKLMIKYNDDVALLQRKADQKSSGFDVHLAASVRAKSKGTYTAVEREWVSVDVVLNPSAWLHVNVVGEIGKGKDLRMNEARLEELDEEELMELEEQDEKDGLTKTKVEGEEEEHGGGGRRQSFLQVMSSANKKKRDATGFVKPLGKWACEFTRDELLVIWAHRRDEDLKTHEEARAWRLLKRFNGSHTEYVEMQGGEARRKLAEEAKSNGVDWKAMRSTNADTGLGPDTGTGAGEGQSLETDVDQRCRTVLHELDRTLKSQQPFVDSAVLHVALQRFPTSVLRLELERELDRLLRETVYERERASKFLIEDSSEEEDESDVDNNNEGHGGKGENGGTGNSGSEDEDGEAARIKRTADRRKDRRATARAHRAQESVKAAQKRILLSKTTLANADADNDSEAARALELSALGFNGCLACRSAKCNWYSNLDVKAVMSRKEQLADEMNYIRKHPSKPVFSSQVALSAQRGGSTRFKREDLIYELMWETRDIERRMKLNGVDRELHDCYATRKEYIEVRVLHGYATLLWTGNARRALEREQNKLVAMATAGEVVDDILEWMLEGWYFGERESVQSVAGYVPSLQKEGFIKPGTQARKATAIKEENERKRKMMGEGKASENQNDIQGTPWEKLVPMTVAAQLRIGKEKVVKLGDERDHVLNETEQTMKFGLFCLTFMYFRAMKMVKREQVSWSGGTEMVGGEDANASGKKSSTVERKKMMNEAKNEADRTAKMNAALGKAKEGEERRKLRQDREKAEAAKKLYDKMRREKREMASSLLLERVYRGHLGRKAARRWARKKAELEAMNALMNASAVNIQRAYRGLAGRGEAGELRMEMAEFIAQIREEEARADEEEYWKTHAVARYKRDTTTFFRGVGETVQSLKRDYQERKAEREGREVGGV